MNRIPPALLYLTIYNPTIRPSCAVPEDNEDAEEQAQILFYTSREQAVSRDQMLRQVGLAKALVNFAENFHSTASYQNVHSQSKRMIMLSPEPNFWIHAAIELAKTPQASLSKTGKGKGKESQDGLPPPEYHDNSVHDSEVHSHLLRGYEEFKIVHGSFTSIISCQGQQALEAQLERFFTVWAWSWDLEGGPSLKMDLGLPLHHLYPAILPAIDSFTSNLPDHLTATFLTPDTIAPSTRYKSLNYPTSLIRHLMTSMKRTQVEASMTALPSSDLQSVINGTGTPSVADPHLSNGFLGISSMAIDIRKWGWTGGFSLSRSPDKKAGVSTPAHYESPPRSTVDGVVTPFDQGALEDAVSNNSFGSAEKEEKQIIHEMAPLIGDMEPLDHPGQQEPQPRDVDTPRPSRVPSPTSVLSEAPPNSHSQMGNEVASIIQFTPITVYIAPNDDPLATCRHTILLLKRDNIAVALLGGDYGDDIPSAFRALAIPATRLLEEVESIISEDAERNLDSSFPSISKILEPRDNHILKLHDYTVGNAGFSSDLGHLYNARGLLEKRPNVVEVFSRNLNPQSWYAVHRGDERGDMYLQIARKEASLSDVDNTLQKLYKSYA